jgi:hypothetical protein
MRPGVLLSGLGYVSSTYCRKPCPVLTLVPESGAIERGECGSIVVDKVTHKVYGHLVGADEELGFGYIVPLVKTIEQIKTAFNTDHVSLSRDNSSGLLTFVSRYRDYRSDQPQGEKKRNHRKLHRYYNSSLPKRLLQALVSWLVNGLLIILSLYSWVRFPIVPLPISTEYSGYLGLAEDSNLVTFERYFFVQAPSSARGQADARLGGHVATSMPILGGYDRPSRERPSQEILGFPDITSTLCLVTTWLLPLANLILNLPFDSFGRKKPSSNLRAALNWLGSPQTALTATTFNFHQLRLSHRRAARRGILGVDDDGVQVSPYLIIPHLNQFDFPPLAEPDGKPSRTLRILIYGLFRPLSRDKRTGKSLDVELTGRLLRQLVSRLRVTRRRQGHATWTSLVFFIISFIFSVTLALARKPVDWSHPYMLSGTLLVAWLPLLVALTMVDQRPVSQEESAYVNPQHTPPFFPFFSVSAPTKNLALIRGSEIISRWLYNVEAVKTWADRSSGSDPEGRTIRWWTTTTTIPPALRVQQFIGQGRGVRYCGLPHALLKASDLIHFRSETGEALERCSQKVATELHTQRRPTTWYLGAVLSFVVVWTAVIAAFLVSSTVPTNNLRRLSLVYPLYGCLSTVTFVIQFLKRPRRVALWLSYAFNALALTALVAAVVLQVRVSPRGGMQ